MKLDQIIWNDCNSTPTRLKVGVTPQSECFKWDVFLNGVKQEGCIEADTKRGFIVQYIKNKFNLYYKNRHGNLATRTKHGKVEFKLKGADNET